jgi:hypothetical protein
MEHKEQLGYRFRFEGGSLDGQTIVSPFRMPIWENHLPVGEYLRKGPSGRLLQCEIYVLQDFDGRGGVYIFMKPDSLGVGA